MSHDDPLQTPVHDLGAHMLLHYTGIAHFSGTNNWELYKRHIDGDESVRKGLANIAETAIEMERALDSGNYEAAGAALKKEWQHRQAMIDATTQALATTVPVSAQAMQPVAGPRWPWWLAFVLCASLLWWLERRR